MVRLDEASVTALLDAVCKKHDDPLLVAVKLFDEPAGLELLQEAVVKKHLRICRGCFGMIRRRKGAAHGFFEHVGHSWKQRDERIVSLVRNFRILAAEMARRGLLGESRLVFRSFQTCHEGFQKRLDYLRILAREGAVYRRTDKGVGELARSNVDDLLVGGTARH